ncbi:MAG: hypothetical protein PVG99_05600, partial [Desulfobacteraceae bacterium]
MPLRAAGGLSSEPQHFVRYLVAAPKSLIDAPDWPATNHGGQAQKIKVATMLILWGCFEAPIMSLVPLKGPGTNVGCDSEERAHG